METSSLSEIKKELSAMPPAKVLEACLRLAKFKKENKELLTYLLFQAHDEQSYIEAVNEEIRQEFAVMNKSNLYLAKKSIRKILRTANRHIRFSGSPQTAAEILIAFCAAVKDSRIPIGKSTALSNLYEAQLKKIRKAVDSMHEDLQYDYQRQLERLG